MFWKVRDLKTQKVFRIPKCRFNASFPNIIFTEQNKNALLDKPIAERKICRFLSDSEALGMMGHPMSFASFFPSGRARRQAIGNAYAVPQIISVLVPMFELATHLGALSRDKQQEPFSSEALLNLAVGDQMVCKIPKARWPKRLRREVVQLVQ